MEDYTNIVYFITNTSYFAFFHNNGIKSTYLETEVRQPLQMLYIHNVWYQDPIVIPKEKSNMIKV